MELFQHLTLRLSLYFSRVGIFFSHSSRRMLQRGWNEQPLGIENGFGTDPSMGFTLSLLSEIFGRDSINPMV